MGGGLRSSRIAAQEDIEMWIVGERQGSGLVTWKAKEELSGIVLNAVREGR